MSGDAEGERVPRIHGTYGGRSVRSALAVRATALALVAIATPVGVSAQDGLRSGCRSADAPEVNRQFCELAVSGVQTLQAHVGIVSAGGNPVPGTASTFGMKLGPLPRMSLASRVTVSHYDLPPIQRVGSSDNPDGFLASLNIDGSLGLFTGFALSPTIGGFLSVDLLGNFGFTFLPEAEGLNGDTPIVWALGARLGITRESFTTPGTSVSFMYRNFGETTFGDGQLSTTDAFLHLDAHEVLNVRAAIGKRLTLVNLTGGVGYDLHSGDVLLSVTKPGGSALELRERDVRTNRFSVFANGALTFLILTLSADAGWQLGGDKPPGTIPGASEAGNSAFFASFAIKLAI